MMEDRYIPRSLDVQDIFGVGGWGRMFSAELFPCKRPLLPEEITRIFFQKSVQKGVLPELVEGGHSPLAVMQGCNIQVRTGFQTGVRFSPDSELAWNGRSRNQDWPRMGSAGLRLGANSTEVKVSLLLPRQHWCTI